MTKGEETLDTIARLEKIRSDLNETILEEKHSFLEQNGWEITDYSRDFIPFFAYQKGNKSGSCVDQAIEEELEND